MAFLFAPAVLSALFTTAFASPSLKPRSVSVLSDSAVNAFTPYTQFARAAYCNPSTTADWSCGDACSANSDFVPYTSGGDGDSVQYCGYSKLGIIERITNGIWQTISVTGQIKTLRLLLIRERILRSCKLNIVTNCVILNAYAFRMTAKVF
jgi:hypothetical protein